MSDIKTSVNLCGVELKNMRKKMKLNVIFLWKKEWLAVSVLVQHVLANPRKKTTTPM